LDQAKHLLGVTLLERPTATSQFRRNAHREELCDNIINTVMDVPGKTKENVKARLDMAEMCDRSELSLRHGVNG